MIQNHHNLKWGNAQFQETFSVYLIGAVSFIAPAIILSVYLLLTLPMQKHTFEESHKEYLALVIMILGFGMNYIVVVNGCHRGKLKKLNHPAKYT